MLRLLQSLNDVRPESMRAFYGLVAEQVRRTLLDLARHYRSRCRRPGEEQAVFALDEKLDAPPSPDSADTTDLEAWEALHEAVTRLSVLEREVFSLAFYNGWKQRDIAELFGLSERHVRRHWVSACLRLREELGPRMPLVE